MRAVALTSWPTPATGRLARAHDGRRGRRRDRARRRPAPRATGPSTSAATRATCCRSPARETVDLPGDNAVYRRDALAATHDVYRDGFWEPEVHRALAGRGHRLLALPGARRLPGPLGRASRVPAPASHPRPEYGRSAARASPRRGTSRGIAARGRRAGRARGTDVPRGLLAPPARACGSSRRCRCCSPTTSRGRRERRVGHVDSAREPDEPSAEALRRRRLGERLSVCRALPRRARRARARGRGDRRRLDRRGDPPAAAGRLAGGDSCSRSTSRRRSPSCGRRASSPPRAPLRRA